MEYRELSETAERRWGEAGPIEEGSQDGGHFDEEAVGGAQAVRGQPLPQPRGHRATADVSVRNIPLCIPLLHLFHQGSSGRPPWGGVTQES